MLRQWNANICSVMYFILLNKQQPLLGWGRVVPQAVSRRLPTATDRVRPRSGHVGSVVSKVALAQVFVGVLRFPLPILIPPTAPHSSSIIRDWYNRPVSGRCKHNRSAIVAVQMAGRGPPLIHYITLLYISGRCTKYTQSHPTPRN
jgi:hypothetical protein